MPSLGGWEIVIIVAILLLLFGAKKLPDMARSVGQSARVFKGEMKGLKDDDVKGKEPAEPAPPQALPPNQAPSQNGAAGQGPAAPAQQPVTPPTESTPQPGRGPDAT